MSRKRGDRDCEQRASRTTVLDGTNLWLRIHGDSILSRARSHCVTVNAGRRPPRL
jgi:hypothetical protein